MLKRPRVTIDSLAMRMICCAAWWLSVFVSGYIAICMRFSYLKYGHYLDVSVFFWGLIAALFARIFSCEVVGLTDCVSQTHNLTRSCVAPAADETASARPATSQEAVWRLRRMRLRQPDPQPY